MPVTLILALGRRSGEGEREEGRDGGEEIL
jgi:hypothetical protein